MGMSECTHGPDSKPGPKEMGKTIKELRPRDQNQESRISLLAQAK